VAQQYSVILYTIPYI